MRALLPWVFAVAALLVVGARTRDGWVIALALATLVAALVAAAALPSL